KRRKKLEETAYANALQSDLAIRVISDGVIVCNSAGHILLINPAAVRLSGWQTGDALGLEVSSVIHLLDEQNQEFVWDMKSMKEPIARNDLRIKGAKLTPVEMNIIPCDITKIPDYKIISGRTGGLSQDNFIITLRDIALEMKSEEARMDFISTASHEMRTPVATIDGYLDLALNPNTAGIDERARGFLEKAKEASKHLGRLFADLLDVTKIDDQRQELRYEKIDVNKFLGSAVEALRGLAELKGLTIQFANDENRVNPIYYIMADARVLSEIVSNLIENAVKYTEKGGITVKVGSNDGFVTISVKDTGIGIGPEYISHIFQKFYRADNRDTREIGGTGLGLYIVKNSVENMHGKVWVESEAGKGSEFFVSLPRVK
ncbi:ATP-binding protein, partial [Candidatus Saccharibacteria bacterium]|nr:ATP-binding protein [Candidatus Saccharibacteria bacterium]